MIEFAQTLFEQTDGRIVTGADHFAELWPQAVRIARGERVMTFAHPSGRN